MKLTIIIVSYNTRQLTLECLASVDHELSQDPHLAKETEVLIVDNNSPDDSAAAIRKFCMKHPAFSLTVNTKNTGFAAANNTAIERAKGQYIFLLNSDTILKPRAIQSLLQAFETHPIDETTAHTPRGDHRLDKLGLLAAGLLNPDGSSQAQGGDIPTLWTVLGHFLLLDDLPLVGRFFPSTQHTGRNARPQPASTSPDTIIQKGWVAATALMVRREVFEEIGLLDPNIFMYGEDVELCLRARHHHWDSGLSSQAQVIHYGSASSGSKNAILGEIRGYVHLWSKHYPLWQIPFLKLILKIGCSLRILLFATIAPNPQRRNWYAEALQMLSDL